MRAFSSLDEPRRRLNTSSARQSRIMFQMDEPAVVPGTRHHTLLTTNEPPNDSELTFIHTDIEYRCARASLSSYRAQNKAILSPLRRVPSEILTEIFLWTLPCVSEMTGNLCKFNVARSPWLLTHISHRWRVVALSTPLLWSQVIIGANMVDPLPAVEARIRRAKNLKIRICGANQISAEAGMFQHLLQHSSRWEELVVEMTPALATLLNAHRGLFSSLKRLWIKWWRGPHEKPVTCFQSAPSLLDVGVVDPWGDIPITLPVHQLTRVHLNCISWERQLGILELGRDLVEVHVTFDQPRPDRDKIIDLPHLRRLYVSPPAALGYFKAPALEELATRVQEADGDILPLLDGFIIRSGCPLRRLCLLECPQAHMTTTILRNLSFLTEFIIISTSADHQEEVDKLMSTLAASKHNGGTMVAPQLRSIFVGCLHEKRPDYEMYLKMLSSRWRAEESALENAVLLLDSDGPDLATLDGLYALHYEGLNLAVLDGENAMNEICAWLYLSRHL
ncbi:F-box domain-containing protein [Mycena sanguinolenta]|uniref:F-box domain-containing protein n=1 Tax=Mycena sanguinolenta TaxID=230812 RepID=A0A8H7DE84_9AGAR|nr:F-box domain-containing protein [Mycena sanguinolenta]